MQSRPYVCVYVWVVCEHAMDEASYGEATPFLI
jgi:hypothetical protein